MNKSELRTKSIEELTKMMTDLDSDVTEAYFEMRTGKLKDVRKPRIQRKDLALLKTIIREKEATSDKDNMSTTKNG